MLPGIIWRIVWMIPVFTGQYDGDFDCPLQELMKSMAKLSNGIFWPSQSFFFSLQIFHNRSNIHTRNNFTSLRNHL